MSNNDITIFAETNFRNQRRKFGIKTDDRRRHMYLIGKTGMGKSTLIENMVIHDIQQRHGVAIVDPHGDLVEKIIKFVPADRINDVIYFNPSDTKFPIAFNILENVDPEYKHLIAYGLVGVFKKIWADSWGPRMEYILTNTILALLEYPGSTLLGIMRLLVDKKYRKKVISKVTDPVVKTFWTDEFANYSEKFRTEAIAPIQNKVGQFLASSIIRNIVGQSKSTIEMRKAIDEGKIILMNLSKGRIGEENSALLGAMMITKIQLAAMSRVDIPENERKDFFLYVDEFQNFATESFANILSEARKYRLNLIMAHQYVEQLTDEVKAAVFGNVGTMVVFRVGATDGEFLEPEFTPLFTAAHLVNIPKYNFYIKLMIDGVSSDPFSAVGLAPVKGNEDNGEKVIKVSRERYARPKALVEERILRWSGVEMPAKEEENLKKEEQLKTSENNKKIPAESAEEFKIPETVPSLPIQDTQPEIIIPPVKKPVFSAPSFINKSTLVLPPLQQPQQKQQPQIQNQQPQQQNPPGSGKKKKKKKKHGSGNNPNFVAQNVPAYIPDNQKPISLNQISQQTVPFTQKNTGQRPNFVAPIKSPSTPPVQPKPSSHDVTSVSMDSFM